MTQAVTEELRPGGTLLIAVRRHKMRWWHSRHAGEVYFDQLIFPGKATAHHFL